MESSKFEIHVPDEEIDDLRERLDRARLPADFANDDWGYGTNIEYLSGLLDYWRTCFDWRQQEAAINTYEHHRVEIDGLPIHYMFKAGVGPSPKPLILTHGWPWTFWDYRKVADRLADPAAYGGDPSDAFHVVVPSLPGFGYSTPLARPGVTWMATADLWRELMERHLGFSRFFAAGGDWGTVITGQLAHKHADVVAGVLVLGGIRLDVWNVERPWDLFGTPPDVLPDEARRAMLDWQKRYASHVSVQVLGAQTLAASLNDSPAGLCAWLLERRRAWSDCDGDVERRFSKDDLLTHISIYWFTRSAGTAARFYREAALHSWEPAHDRSPVLEAPTAITIFQRDGPLVAPEDAFRDYANLVQYRVHESGGHFGPAEEPEVVASDIRDAFRSRS